jgi:hypothetical protein
MVSAPTRHDELSAERQCGVGNLRAAALLPADATSVRRRVVDQRGSDSLSPDDPFISELKCIAVDETGQPVARNDLIGDAMISKQFGRRTAHGIPRLQRRGHPGDSGKERRDPRWCSAARPTPR